MASSRLRSLGVDDGMITAIYKLPFKITRETKLSIFQYKIIHNILPHRSLLYKMKISESRLCLFCKELESLPHMLVDCPHIRDFWNSVLLVWNKQNNENYLFDEFSIMYGYHPENPGTFIFNYFILLSKRHVFLSKIDGNSPDICLFLETLKDKLAILRSIANSKGQEVKFKHIWKPLLSIAQI